MPKAATRMAGWTTVAFGDVVRLSTGRSSNPESDGFERFVGLEHLEPGDLRIRRWGDVADGTTFTTVFRPGQVLFGKRRAYQRKVAVADFSGVCSGDIYVLEPKGEDLLPELLPFICQTDAFFEHAVRTSAGSLSPRTNWTSLSGFKFPLPPIEEQRRIAGALRAIEAAAETQHALAERSITAARALLDFRLRALGEAPMVPIGDLLVGGPKNGLSPRANPDDGRFRTVSIGAVSNGVFDPTDQVKYVDLTPEQAAPYLVRKGDIFIVRGNGNRQLVARVGQSSESYDDLIFPDLLIRVRFDPTRVANDFLIAQWNHPSVHGRILTRAKSSNGIWKVNGQDIRSHELIVPPLDVQKAIAKSLHSLIAATQTAESRKATLARIKARIVEQAAREAGYE